MEAPFSFLGSTKPNLSFLLPSSNVLHRRLRRDFPIPVLNLKKGLVLPRISHRNRLIRAQSSDRLVSEEENGFVLEDVPHLTKFLPDLPYGEADMEFGKKTLYSCEAFEELGIIGMAFGTGSNSRGQPECSYPSLAVSQNTQFAMSGIGPNAQEYGRTHITSTDDPSRAQQEPVWKSKTSGT